MPRVRSFVKDDGLLRQLIGCAMLGDSIPITYYGDEQTGAVGATDPQNREAMWTLGSSAYDVSPWGSLDGKYSVHGCASVERMQMI